MCYPICNNKRCFVNSSTELPTPELLEHFPMVRMAVSTLVKIRRSIYKSLMKYNIDIKN